MSNQEHFFDEDIEVKNQEDLKKPRFYKVILLNDDYTTMEFVIEVLKHFFHKSESEAAHIMMTIHKKGKGVAGVFTYEIAETKVTQVNNFSKTNKHPLKCIMEAE